MMRPERGEESSSLENSKGETEKESLKLLNDQLSDPALKSSTRVLILISLSVNKKLSFVELLALTGLGKGSLENHLDKLSKSDYVKTRNVKTFGGMREIVEITDKGFESCRSILKLLQNVNGI
jgi:DNA-binding MarR family transcriptional regulator